MRKTTLLSFVFVALTAQAAWAAGVTRVTLTGQGASKVTPRKVALSMVLSAKGAKAATAGAENATTVANLKAALLAVPGVAEKNVKLGAPTTNIEYKYDTRGNALPTGYVTSQIVTVEVAANANNVHGQVFDAASQFNPSLSAQPVVTAKALKGASRRAELQAVKDAKLRASSLAKQLGLSGVKVVEVTEASAAQSPYRSRGLALEAVSTGNAAPTQFDVRTQEIVENRSVVFELY